MIFYREKYLQKIINQNFNRFLAKFPMDLSFLKLERERDFANV